MVARLRDFLFCVLTCEKQNLGLATGRLLSLIISVLDLVNPIVNAFTLMYLY